MHCLASPDALCEACFREMFERVRPVAQRVGVTWADDVAAGRGGRGTSWPEDSSRLLIVARNKVHHLTRDPRLVGQLALEALAAAERHWRRR